MHNIKTCSSNSHKKLMFQNLMNALIQYGSLKTTLYKAKKLARLIEPLITKSKIDNLSNRRYVFNLLRNKKIVKILFWQSKMYFLQINGGYTRIIKTGFRKGDNAPLAYITLIIKKN